MNKARNIMDQNIKGRKIKVCHIADLNQVHCRRYIGYFIQHAKQEITVLNCQPLAIDNSPLDSFSGDYKLYNIGSKFSMFIIKYKIPIIRKVLLFLGYLQVFLRIKRAIRKIKPDILHVQNASIESLLAILTAFRPIIIFPWGGDVLEDPYRSPLRALLLRYVLKRASIITPNSEIVAKGCIKFGASKEKIQLIQIGLDIKKYRPKQSVDHIRKKLQIADNDPVILSARNFRPLYNIETIIRSIPFVLRKNPDAKYVFLRGKIETQEKEILALIEKMGISHAVRYVGYVENNEEMPYYFSLADIYISVPFYDSSSSALQEAMASGAVPIASDIPANHAWIKDGYNGYIIPVKSYEGIASRINLLISDRSLRQNMANINREIVVKRSDKDMRQAEFELIYEGLMRC
ncbi:MAG: glycosyltransferase family 4 protein [Candidatus Margulisiibacteriota bacterium]